MVRFYLRAHPNLENTRGGRTLARHVRHTVLPRVGVSAACKKERDLLPASLTARSPLVSLFSAPRERAALADDVARPAAVAAARLGHRGLVLRLVRRSGVAARLRDRLEVSHPQVKLHRPSFSLLRQFTKTTNRGELRRCSRALSALFDPGCFSCFVASSMLLVLLLMFFVKSETIFCAILPSF